MSHWRLLREAGVEIVTCQGGRLRFDHLGGIITAIIDQHGAREGSVNSASRAVGGQRLRASQGKRIGGIVYGYDREMYDDRGNFGKRVGFREKFRKPPTWSSALVPSADSSVVEGIRWMFESVRDGQSVGQKIERGAENLALADRDNFAAVSKLLAKWRDDEAALLDRIQKRNVELEPLADAIAISSDWESTSRIYRKRIASNWPTQFG